MKNILLFGLLLMFIVPMGCNTIAQDQTTYYLIRHAEKDRTDPANRNPNLNENGQARAQRWAAHFEDIELDAVYSTEYNRTQQTAAPTAKTKNLDVRSYDPRNLFDSIFAAETKGKTVLVVGHSNTTPAFVNAIIGKDQYPSMDDNDNSSLYKVVLKDDSNEVVILKVE